MSSSTSDCVLCGCKTTDKKTVLVCHGVCGRSFHLDCLTHDDSSYKTKSQLVSYLSKIRNLHWYCNVRHELSVCGVADNIIESAKSLAKIKSTLKLDQPNAFNAADMANVSTPNKNSAENNSPQINPSQTSTPKKKHTQRKMWGQTQPMTQRKNRRRI